MFCDDFLSEIVNLPHGSCRVTLLRESTYKSALASLETIKRLTSPVTPRARGTTCAVSSQVYFQGEGTGRLHPASYKEEHLVLPRPMQHPKGPVLVAGVAGVLGARDHRREHAGLGTGLDGLAAGPQRSE
jgi:hypothetical protein